MKKKTQAIVTLLTDFGLQDEFVGVLKGVLLSRCPHLQIVDLSHQIPPQNIRAAAFLLNRAYRFFPRNTIHLAVVDPGVGSQRRLLAIETSRYTFIGPDNGLFTPIFERENILDIREITEQKYFLENQSTTFHGRDIMAPVAGLLASGMPIDQVGKKITVTSCAKISSPSPSRDSRVLRGEIIYIDGFGNCSTNLRREDIEGFAGSVPVVIHVGKHCIERLVCSYSEGTIGAPLALYDSHDCLEIAQNSGNLSKSHKLFTGEPVTVLKKEGLLKKK